MVYYVLPTLEHISPFRGANKPLLEHTLDSIQKKFHRRIIVATDQEWALDFVQPMRVKGMPASDQVSSAGGSYRDVLLDVANKMNMHDDDDFVMLSLEYPGRTYRNIRSCIQYYQKHEEATSLLCKRPSSAKAQKLFVERGENKGDPLIEDEGQEWREPRFSETFVHSHFVTIHQVSELPEVNNWLWNENTIFFPIGTDIRRVRTREELKQFEKDEEQE